MRVRGLPLSQASGALRGAGGGVVFGKEDVDEGGPVVEGGGEKGEARGEVVGRAVMDGGGCGGHGW